MSYLDPTALFLCCAVLKGKSFSKTMLLRIIELPTDASRPFGPQMGIAGIWAGPLWTGDQKSGCGGRRTRTGCLQVLQG